MKNAMRDYDYELLKEIIEVENIECGKSIERICKDYGLVYNTVRRVMDKYGIKTVKRYRKHEGSYGLPKTKWCVIRRNAKKRNIDLNIDIEFAGKLLELQNNKCALSGLEISMIKKSGKVEIKDVTASLDRIDSNRGYEENNVWWLHKDVNLIKSDLSLIEFLGLCKLVIKPLKRKNPEKFKNLPKDLLSDMKYNAKKRNIEILINDDFLLRLFEKQHGCCAITGLPLSLEWREREGAKLGKRLRTASVDRINSDKGYLESNVFWTHKNVNQSRKHFDLDYYKHLCKLIIEYRKKRK